jgi:transposase
MYSIDFRKLALRLYKQFKSYRKVAEIMNISTSTIHRWKTKGIEKSPKRQRRCKIFEKTRQFIESYLSKNPFTTQWELAVEIMKEYQMKVSLKTISRILKKLSFSKKKAYHYNVGRFNPPKESICNLITTFEKHPSTLHSIDECYFSEKVLANYGWSRKGEPLHSKMQPKGWKKRSLLFMVQNDGSFKFQVIHGSVNKDSFNAFIHQNLPKEHPVLLDNCAFHKCMKDDRKVFVPPYCPMFNPVEYCFSKIKGEFRKLFTSGKYSFDNSLLLAINSLKAENIVNSFNHVLSTLNKVNESTNEGL